MKIIVASARTEALQPFVNSLMQLPSVAEVTFVSTPDAVLHHVQACPPALILVDSILLPDNSAEFITNIMQHNAFVHVAYMSEQPEATLHDSMEGLGLVAFLPLVPQLQEATKLVATVQEVGYLGQPQKLL